MAMGPASFADLLKIEFISRAGPNAAMQALCLLIHSGQVFPAGMYPDNDCGPARRINRVVVKRMLEGRVYNFLAAPIPGSGVQATPAELLMLAAVFNGQGNDVKSTSEYVLKSMKPLGISWLKEGKPVTDENELMGLVDVDVSKFLNEKLPLWRQLGVL